MDDPARDAENPSAGQEHDASKLDGIVLLVLPFSCCLLPLILSALAGLSVWLERVPGYAGSRPWLAAAVAVALGFIWRRIYRGRAICTADGTCRVRPAGMGAKVIFWVLAFAAWDILGEPSFAGNLF